MSRGAALRPVQAAIVDLDGTMVDTLGDFEVALNTMLAELGLAGVDRAFIEHTVGKGSEHLIRQTLVQVGGDAALFEAGWAAYQRHYLAINGAHAAVYPGVVEGLARMQAQGWALACLTNKPRAFALPLLQAKGLAPFFSHVFGGDSFARKKPDPLPLLETCRALGTAPARHADAGRQQQRRPGRPRRRLPGVAGELWLQPRSARHRRGCRWRDRPTGPVAAGMKSGVPGRRLLSALSAVRSW